MDHADCSRPASAVELGMSETLTFTGQLAVRDFGDESDVLHLDGHDKALSEELEVIAKKTVTARYWLTDEQVSREQAQEQFMRKVFGAADVQYSPHYSEVTGYLWTDEDLMVGGHDLLAELTSAAGKWLILEVEVH